MQHRKTLSSLIVAPLAVLAIAAPAAPAVPVDARQLDMYASTVQKPEPAKQDLRTEAAADAAVRPQTGTDLRTEAAVKEPPVVDAPAGLPVWPRHPEPVVPVSDTPVATTGDGDGIEWPLAGVVIGAALLLGGTLGVAGTRRRLSHA